MPDIVTDASRRGEDLAARLRACGIKPTPHRVEIASILLSRPQHLSAEQILERAEAAGLSVSKATVYNTLGLFARHRLVREVIVDPSKIFYDSNPEPHYHFFDTRTGSLTDIARERIAIGGLPALPDDAQIEGIDVIVRIRSREG